MAVAHHWAIQICCRHPSADLGRKRSIAVQLIIYQPEWVSRNAFVEFWSARYQYGNGKLYDENIGRELTEKRILELFTWKNGILLSVNKLNSVTRNFVARRAELADVDANANVEQFLEVFNSGGAIWRIFWLHCWYPQRFPIYDQHVHRAMRFIETGRVDEIPKTDPDKIKTYTSEYQPFHDRFAGLDTRSVDKSLWAFGKFIKENNFPTQPTR